MFQGQSGHDLLIFFEKSTSVKNSLGGDVQSHERLLVIIIIRWKRCTLFHSSKNSKTVTALPAVISKQAKRKFRPAIFYIFICFVLGNIFVRLLLFVLSFFSFFRSVFVLVFFLILIQFSFAKSF